MELKKIKQPFFFFALPLVLVFVTGILSAACSKNHTTITNPVNNPPISTDSMANSSNKTYLALGDSYTIGTSVTEADRYPVQTTTILKVQGINMSGTEIIATNGWTTADLMNAVNTRPATDTFDVVSLLIGVNNQYQGRTLTEYKQQFTTLLQRSIQFAKNKPSHVFVISIPDYSVTPFARGRNLKEIAAEIDMFNDANKTIADSYKVNYLYITDESRKAAKDPSLIASDSLHFSGKEYEVWSYKLAPMMKAVLQ